MLLRRCRHLIYGGMRSGGIWMDIALCRCKFGVAHNLLNYGRCNIAQSQRSCGGVAAGVRREVSASGIFYSSMIFQIELVTIHAEDVIFPAL